ncbi:MAG TPA: isoprenylcysteine carboxylmethyltransferase family protein [Lacipirellulaceae bacterium]|nr:isoprenylcysteine carboxylmethyltransferase family protein [Lacipirellulaceae bacterium]
MYVRKVILSVVWNAGAFSLALFPAAGTLDWWRAWLLLGVVVVSTVVTMFGVFRTRPQLLNERMKGVIQKGQPTVDRVIVLTFLVAFAGSIVLIPLDVFHFHIFRAPAAWASAVGLLLFITGWSIIALSFRDNAFAVPVVRHQTERQHAVADTGVYAVVRHPLYAGVMLLNIGMPLWLESYAAVLASIVPAGTLVVRILFEERFLRRELPGYLAYSEMVRYRLVPYVW